jgi:hypothetical protein
MQNKRCSIVLLAMLLITQAGIAQYTLNGSAVSDNCHCYTLTPDLNNQGGSVWNNFKIDLTQSFHFNFDIYLGCNDAGADGIVFVLQPVSTSIGSAGGGLGYQNVSPSVGVSIDTWQNSDAANNDPAYDHIAIQLNGNLDHTNSSVNIAGPETVLPGIDNIEDCQWHTLRVEWDAAAKNLTAWVDGQLRVTANKDLVADVFGGQPLVFWGFTGSTGGARNRQQFCTSLTPQYRLLPNQKDALESPFNFLTPPFLLLPFKNYTGILAMAAPSILLPKIRCMCLATPAIIQLSKPPLAQMAV